MGLTQRPTSTMSPTTAALPDKATIPPVCGDSDTDTTDLGSFASTETEEEDIEELAEPFYKYSKKDTSRVFCPICIGEVLNKRYCIEHKLGHGGFATVWLAHDLETGTDVALKIMASGKSGELEVRMQEEIMQSVQDISHLVTYLATFSLSGEDGCDHRVLVFPWRGDCLDTLRVKKMSMATRMSAARQLLEALESLHNAGIVHRDLNDRNCFWGTVPLHHLNRKAKYQLLGRPLKQSISWVDGLWKPGEYVKPLTIPMHLHDDTFYLGDFGLAMKLGNPVVPEQDGRPPTQFCSPERLHKRPPSIACDMWSYLCIFAELYIGFTPFTTMADGGAVTSMVRLLGPLPEDWKGEHIDPEYARDSWYDQDNKPSPDFNLRTQIERMHPDAGTDEWDLVYSILTRGFSYVPEERLTATQLLRDASFKALMDRYC
ncbi:hypothetical protein FQN53_006218 [Emmonsiellopsis sp. PD_33]|nr:hypothetical protein FQN53_006218 [Emmonsiellopsis sp. PD_33]